MTLNLCADELPNLSEIVDSSRDSNDRRYLARDAQLPVSELHFMCDISFLSFGTTQFSVGECIVFNYLSILSSLSFPGITSHIVMACATHTLYYPLLYHADSLFLYVTVHFKER